MLRYLFNRCVARSIILSILVVTATARLAEILDYVPPTCPPPPTCPTTAQPTTCPPPPSHPKPFIVENWVAKCSEWWDSKAPNGDLQSCIRNLQANGNSLMATVSQGMCVIAPAHTWCYFYPANDARLIHYQERRSKILPNTEVPGYDLIADFGAGGKVDVGQKMGMPFSGNATLCFDLCRVFWRCNTATYDPVEPRCYPRYVSPTLDMSKQAFYSAKMSTVVLDSFAV